MKSTRTQNPLTADSPRMVGLPSQIDSHRRGSVLLVVIGLLSLLLLAGIAFYTFASQENSAAEYYAEAANVGNPLKLSADELFAFGMEQLILGPDSDFTMSALRGGRAAPGTYPGQQIEIPGRHSLIAGVIGNDTAVYNGLGINLATDTTPMGTLAGAYGYPYVDQDQDGSPDNASLLSQLNYSASANSGTAPPVPLLPAPDTGYTAPDINSPYLAYLGYGTDYASGLSNDHRVIIPTFHRPQYLRGGVAAMTTAGNGNSARLFRPHPDNKCPNGSSRFLNASIAHPTVASHTVTPFPFSNNPGGGAAISQGVWDLTGPPGAAPTYVYNWDVDNDGDGIREGVWLDLDYPIQDLADGRSFVPMFSFTVVDSDGLINLNASGNSLAWMAPPGGNPTTPPIAYPGTYTNFVHRSNMGMSRSEINPLWGLFADGSINPSSNPVYFSSDTTRDSALTQMRVLWQLPSAGYPATNISRLDTANMDYLSLLLGRVDFARARNPGPGTYAVDGNYYAASGFFPGRRGETWLLSNTAAPVGIAPVGGSVTTFAPGGIPLPGSMGFDDDNDRYATTSMVHPIDYLGTGSSYTVGAGTAVTQMLLGRADNANNPCRWPAYNGYHNLQYSSGGNSVSYISANAGSSFVSPLTDMTDEEDEEVVDTDAQSVALNSKDSMFGLAEMFALHGSDTDYAATSSNSRLRSLAHFNFSENKYAELIRKQYTVMSMDRLQFGLGSNARRTSEANADLDSDGHFEFPPAAVSSNCGSPAEPIRLPLRQYLTVEFGSNQLSSVGGFRLNMNKLVWTTNPANPLAGQTYLRDLTYHPVDPGTSDVYSNYTGGATAYPPNPADPIAMEWWARHDRQLLARDIYCLLYILGGGSDSAIYQDAQPIGATPTADSNAARGLYSDAQLKEMAQFAVNYVDALDFDDHITMFEYDRDLGDGWNLGDDPYQTGDDNVGGAIGANDRAVVYGVETQSLTLAEGLVIHTPQLVSDQAGATTFNDTTERWYTALELRNASAFDVDLTAKSWRIRVIDQALDQTPPLAPTIPSPERYLTFKQGSIGHGNNFLIGSRTGTDLDKDNNARPSDFRVNIDHETETPGDYRYETIVPSANSAVLAYETAADPGTHFDLDLVTQNGTGAFDLYNDSTSVTVTPPGDFVNSGGAGTTVRFVIERRLHLTRSSLASTTDNPWIEVDRMDAPVKEFNITAGMSGADLKTMVLPNLISKERAQPFSRNSEGNNTPVAASPHLANSFGLTANSNTTSAFTNWQPHFNRPYTSVIDLLTLPLFGPKNFTQQFGLGVDWNTNANWGTTPNFAQERFLRTIDSANMQNRWYRLLGLLGVPSRSQTTVVQPPYALRTPGMINLNTMRDRGVFNGLVDDISTQFPNGALDATTPNTLVGHMNPYFNSLDPRTMCQDPAGDYNGVQRDWWAEFLAARNQQDPITQLYLPGMAHSRPYRSMNYTDSGATSVEYTLLRGMVKDGTAVTRRGVFEASRNLNTATDPVDFHTRHRLLRKVANNSTTRSNVFSVWVSVGLFEAVQQPNGDVQIGGPINGTGVPTFRGFFVVDRSLPEQGLDAASGQFDFEQFIKYRKTIR